MQFSLALPLVTKTDRSSASTLILLHLVQIQGCRSVSLTEALGISDKLQLGVVVGLRCGALYEFASTPLDCKKTPFLCIKVHPILDRIGCLFYDIAHLQKGDRGTYQHQDVNSR